MEATLIKKRDLILAVRDRWNKQYSHYGDDNLVGAKGGEPVRDIKARLALLDLQTATESDVDKAIGVPGWVSNDCDLCDRDFDVLLRIGEEPDYEARWLDICEECCSTLTSEFHKA